MGRKPAEPIESAFVKLGDNAAKTLIDYVNQLDALQESKREISTKMKEVYLTAKNNGFNTKPLKKVMRLREQEDTTRVAFWDEVRQMCKAVGVQLDLFGYAQSVDGTGKSTESEADDLAA